MSRGPLKRSRATPPSSRRQYVLASQALPIVRDADGARGEPFPRFIPPLLATEAARPPPGDNYVHEIKFDGYRLQLHLQEQMVRCYTRRGHDWTERFPSLRRALPAVASHAAIIDGEAVVLTDDGETDFGALESYVTSKQPDREKHNLVFYAFDLLHLDGLSLRDVALIDRKRALEALLADLGEDSPICISEHLEVAGGDVFRSACALGLEGVVSKRVDSRYRSDRQDAWLKTVCRRRETFLVAGIAFKGRKFDGVYLAEEQTGRLIYAGKVERGFDDRQAAELQAAAAEFSAPRAPFDSVDRAFPKAHWLRPSLLAEVEYRARTKRGGLLRHPSYKGLRLDLMDQLGAPPKPVRGPSARRMRSKP